MRLPTVCVATLAALFASTGCRTAARVTTVPRVDLAMEGAGNRGYLVGTAPPVQELKTKPALGRAVRPTELP